MGKLRCTCGHLISTTSDATAYSGDLIPGKALDDAFDGLSELISELVAATRRGDRREWIDRHFGDDYPDAFSEAELIDNLLFERLSAHQREVFQCTSCLRLWVETRQSCHFAAFIPESPDSSAGILDTEQV